MALSTKKLLLFLPACPEHNRSRHQKVMDQLEILLFAAVYLSLREEAGGKDHMY